MIRTLIALEETGTVPLGEGQIKGLGPIADIVDTSGEGVTAQFTAQLSNIIGFLTLLGGLFFVIYFIIAGFEWLQSGGDQGKADKARTRMTNAAIGLLIMVLATALVGIVGGVFGLDLLNPGEIFLRLIPGGDQ